MEVDDFFGKVENANECSCGILKKAESDYLYNFKPIVRGDGRFCFIFEMPELIELRADGSLNPYTVFLNYLKTNFPEAYNNCTLINAIGCRPLEGKLSNSINSFTECFNLNVLPKLKEIKPMVIFTLGRSIYSLTGDTFMPKSSEADVLEEFYKPLHDYRQLTKFYYTETDSMVFPLPRLLSFCNNRKISRYNSETGTFDTSYEPVQVLDKFETEFVRRQVMIGIGTANLYLEKNYPEDNRYGIVQPKLTWVQDCDVEDKLNELISSEAEFLFVDTETSGKTKTESLNPFACKLICIQVGISKDEGFFIEYDSKHNSLWDKLFSSKKNIIHNALFDLRVLRHHGMSIECFYDTMIGFHYGIDSNLKAGLKPLTYRYTPFGGYENELDIWKEKYGCEDYGKIPKDILFKYATMDVIVLACIFDSIYEESISRAGELVMGIAMPFINTIAWVQDNPFLFRSEVNLEIHKKFTEISRLLEKDLLDELGDINLSSNDAVGRSFEEKGLPLPSVGRNKKGLYKVGKDSILFWKNKGYDIATKYEEHKGLAKLIDTFVGEEKCTVEGKNKDKPTGIWKYIHNNRIMTNYLLGVVKSLRIACTSMNLQNIPKKGQYAKDIRRQFGLPEGWGFAELDFSGFQLRIMAILSGDENMRDIFCSDNDDLHLMTAIKLGILSNQLPTDITFEECHKALNDKSHKLNKIINELRKKSKGVNFGFIFSLASRTFANDDKNFDVKALEKMTNEEILSEFKKYKGKKELYDNGRIPTVMELREAMSELFRNAFFGSYPKILQYTHEVQKKAIEQGYVESVMHGRRYLEPLHFDHVIDSRTGKVVEHNGRFVTRVDADNKRVANLLARAINSPVQAFESHIIMKAMNRIKKVIQKNRRRTKIVGQIHDAIIFMYPIKEEEKFLKDYVKIMEIDDPKYKGIPIKADCVTGDIFGFEGAMDE